MAACLAAHSSDQAKAAPRLELVATRSVSMPVGCRHCIDAPCVASCPTSCLYNDKGRVAVKDGCCIGCCSCMLACPFGAISIGSHPKRIRFGGLSFDSGTEPVVIKCDLCIDRNDNPACVEACPTAGLFVVDEPVLSEEAKRKRARAATSEHTRASSVQATLR